MHQNSRLKDQSRKAESTSAAAYGSAEHREKFADSLANTGSNETQIRGHFAAARSVSSFQRADSGEYVNLD